MSIIYDALKKVEKINDISSSLKTKGERKPKLKPYLLYTLVIVLGFFIANIIFNIFAKHLQNNTKVLVRTDVVTKIQPHPELPQDASSSLETKPPLFLKTQKQPPPSLVLNGVFFSGDEGYALINNQVAKVGDIIDGARLLQITLDGVELEAEGVTIKLPTNK